MQEYYQQMEQQKERVQAEQERQKIEYRNLVISREISRQRGPDGTGNYTAISVFSALEKFQSIRFHHIQEYILQMEQAEKS